MFKVLDKSYLNVSGNIYDADFISLAQVANDKLSFDERTLFLDQSVKDTLNKETIMPFESVIYIGKYKGKYSLICDLDIEWYKKGHIKIHELVLPDTVQGMLSNFHDYNTEASQITLVHEECLDYEAIMFAYEPDFIFEHDEVEVRAYTGEKAEDILRYVNAFENIYIADGHHRIYSTSLSEIKKSASVSLMNLQDISILSIDRIIPEVSGEQFEIALNRFEASGMLCEDARLEKGVVHMEYKGKKYYLKLKCFDTNAFKNNDIYRLNTQILSFGFRVLDTRDLLYFVDNEDTIKYMNEHEDAVSFTTFPIDFSEFAQIVRNGQIMPPKSTFFYPKFPSFLVLKQYKRP